MQNPTEVSPEIVAFLDAYSVLPLFSEIEEHLEVLESDHWEARGLLRADLERVVNRLRSTLITARAFMQAWDSLMSAALRVEEDVPQALVGGLLNEAVKLSKMLAEQAKEMDV